VPFVVKIRRIPMPTKVLVPRLGEGVEEVTISKWLKQEGESVKELEALLEVNTDKVDTEIPSPATGVVLKLVLPEGTVARVGEVLAVIGQPGEKADAPETVSPASHVADAQPKLPSAPAANPAVAVPTGNGDLGFISPVVAKMAAEYGINLQQVKGTGLGGRITKNDVLAFVEKGGASAQTTGPAITARVFQQQGDQLIKHTIIRKSIAEHMVTSKNISPHVLTVMEADMSRVAAHRAANKEPFARDGVNLTYTAYFVAAIAAGLKAYPLTNSSWSDEGILVHKAVNIGMATSLGEEGLIVPVIKGADGLSLLGVARAVNDLSSRARAKKLQPDEVKGGTFTLTNHGVSGSLLAMPIINQPQCGILGVGAMQKRAVVISSKDGTGDDAIAIRPMIYLSFVFDHRILDGASADWFLVKVKETLENWQ
jgi:pyruvate/2-oxoglutarate dehydrogenase complex dihydrolipoamide acyltransferase (E2) component